jgi:hypothetical protein
VTVGNVDLAGLSPLDLLALHSAIGDELRKRELVRSSNNPAGDLAETLFCKSFGWVQAPNSMPAADAVSSDGVKFQIKSRRITTANGSRQLSAIRNLDHGGFDFLAGILFESSYSILRAALIPLEIVKQNSKHQSHTNSALFHLKDSVWELDGVVDVTMQLRNYAVCWK